MSKLVSFVRSFYDHPSHRCLILGADSAGKTTALYRMVLGEVVQTIPTIGFNYEEVKIGRDTISFWDVGGCDRIRPLMRHYMVPGHCVLFLVDTAWCVARPENLEHTLDEMLHQGRAAAANEVLFFGVALVKHDLLLLPAADAREHVAYVAGRAQETMDRVFAGAWRWKYGIYTNDDGGGISAFTGRGFEDGWLVGELLGGIKRALRGGSAGAAEILEVRAPVASLSQKDAGARPRDAEQLRALVEEQSAEDPYTGLTPVEFLGKMGSGELEKWDHRAHLRAGFYVLLEHLKAGQGLWDAVEDFLGKLESMLSSDSKKAEAEKREKRFRNTVHRTMTTFYLHSIHTAVLAFMDQETVYRIPSYKQFNALLLQSPHLMDSSLWSTYYSKYLMFSPAAKSSWRLPDLKPLPDYIRLQTPSNSRNTKIKDRKETGSSPPLIERDRLQRFAFITLQRVKLTGERRGRVIKEALEALQKHTMSLRAQGLDVEPYSETKAYFWIQILHAAVESLGGGGAGTRGVDITRLSFESFVLLFPDLMRRHDKGKEIWRTHYTEKAWESMEARMGVVLPSLKPLPNIIVPPTENERDAAVAREVEIRSLVQNGAVRNISETELMLHEFWVVSKFQEGLELMPSHGKVLWLIFSKLWKAKFGASTSIGIASNELVDGDLRGHGDLPLGVTEKIFWIRMILKPFLNFEVTLSVNESEKELEKRDEEILRDFRRFLGVNREFSLEDLWRCYYSEETWQSEDAKERFVLPDVNEVVSFVSPAACLSDHRDFSLRNYVIV